MLANLIFSISTPFLQSIVALTDLPLLQQDIDLHTSLSQRRQALRSFFERGEERR